MNDTSLESFTKYVHDTMIEIQISLHYLKIKSKITLIEWSLIPEKRISYYSTEKFQA